MGLHPITEAGKQPWLFNDFLSPARKHDFGALGIPLELFSPGPQETFRHQRTFLSASAPLPCRMAQALPGTCSRCLRGFWGAAHSLRPVPGSRTLPDGASSFSQTRWHGARKTVPPCTALRTAPSKAPPREQPGELSQPSRAPPCPEWNRARPEKQLEGGAGNGEGGGQCARVGATRGGGHCQPQTGRVGGDWWQSLPRTSCPSGRQAQLELSLPQPLSTRTAGGSHRGR